ncbi:MAG TPA: MlaD family protein [Baekduia sp.]|uniref:MlaD family protein n=1 Tax=Baekduia sp. TaxID=2600305 RepID=UPI002D7A23F2|nr:MlaD family protein [Baekduia sp.]HET6509313.1 MlaD family protein [Baekduia sp.]
MYIAAISTAVRHPSRAPRGVAVIALLLIAAVVAWLLLRSKPHEYRLVFSSAGQLVKGDVVRVGGTGVGSVTKVGLSDDDQAEIDIKIKSSYGPLHQGSTATIRAEGLTGVASRYVDIDPAPSFKPVIDDHAVIKGDKTTSIVEIDQLFDTLDPKTRKGLAGFIKGSASWYDGRADQANASAKEFPKALTELSAVADELTRDNGAFEQFLIKADQATRALADHHDQLTSLVSNTRETTAALSADTQSLTQALDNVPTTLRKGSDTFADLRAALPDLQKLTDSSKANTKDLAPFLNNLTPVLRKATPTFSELRRMFSQPGDYNDLLDALRELPSTAKLTDRTFPSGRKALQESSPIFAFGRPYVSDLIGWVTGYDSAAAAYDANGHYIHSTPIFNAYTFSDDGSGGTLTPRPFDQRGTSPALTYNNLRRCPGTSVFSPADGSAPFLDDGDLAKNDCDPSQTVRAAG